MSGNQIVTELLGKMAIAGTLNHAYIFVGNEHSQKTEVAWSIARLILKTEGEAIKHHPDVRVLSRTYDEKTEQMHRDISIEEIRVLLRFAQESSFKGGPKVIIIRGRWCTPPDEATGGTHFSLVIAGATGTSLEAAEALKKDPQQQTRLFPIIRPVMEKVASIVTRHLQDYAVDRIYLVGGTCAYPGMAQVIEEYTGIETVLPGNPLFVTPLGIAMEN